jgi:hypothetical protein
MRRVIWLQTPTVFLVRWSNHFSQLFSAMGLLMLRRQKKKKHIAESLVPEPSAFQGEMAIGKKKDKSSGTDQIPAELFKSGGRTIYSVIPLTY